MIFLPFKMKVETKMERYRRDTFWFKEPETIAWIKSFNNREAFFDVGANIGIYSLYCATLYPDSQICAFEPDNNNFSRLLENIRINNFSNILPSRTIICEKTGQKDFIPFSDEIGSSGGQMCDTDGVGWTCSTIDDLIIYSFDFPDPDHIKIDIDGQELKIVQGMKETLKTARLKSVLIEIGQDRDEIISAFIKNGFTMKNEFNEMKHHSRVRRAEENINVENIIFTRG